MVIGGGPAGLQLGYFLSRGGRDHCIVDRSASVGSFWERLPRNGKLISFNKVHAIYDDPEMLLRWDWNSLLCDYQLPFREHSQRLYPLAREMKAYLEAFQERFDIRVELGSPVRQISKRGDRFEARTDDAIFVAPRLVMATGLSKPYLPAIDGIELLDEGYENCPFEPEAYAAQRVLILGKGNSAFELANELIDTTALLHLASPQPIRFAWETRHPGHLRADYTRLLDTYQLKLLNSVLDCDVLQIRRHGQGFRVRLRYTHAEGEVDELYYDRVIRCTGFAFDPSPFHADIRPELSHQGRLPAMTAGWESVNVPNLFFAGTLMQARDFKKASSAFVDGFRYNIRALFHMLEQRFYGTPLPHRVLPASMAALTDVIVERICRTSGLWAQFGYLADVIGFDDQDRAVYYEELPVDWVLTSGFADAPRITLITFEWGQADSDVFALQRRPRADAAHRSAFLHPVLRSYRYGELESEHHMLEDLFGMYGPHPPNEGLYTHNGRRASEYHQREHVAPLRHFLEGVLRPTMDVAG